MAKNERASCGICGQGSMSSAYYDNFLKFVRKRNKLIWPMMNIKVDVDSVRLGISCGFGGKNCYEIETSLSSFDDQDGLDVFKVPGEKWQLCTVMCFYDKCTASLPKSCCNWLVTCFHSPIDKRGISYAATNNGCFICNVSFKYGGLSSSLCCSSRGCKNIVTDFTQWVRVYWTLCEMDFITQDVRSYMANIICTGCIEQVYHRQLAASS